MKKKGISLVEMMIAIMILGVGIVFVTKMFGQGGYVVAKSKWELYAMCLANGEIERINFYSGAFSNLKASNKGAANWQDKWSPLDPGTDFLANKSVIPQEYLNAEYQKKISIEMVPSGTNNFLAKVNVSIKWHEMTSSGNKGFQLNVPTLIATPKPFFEYKQ
ncbi:MAG: prepilin-type N-terminal cleavage/methylation domain-containing protein [Candidatus Wallbacteria bacterium]|nr:prepilin-type N-terminal cleavage/methylation domain-containing protein [Candidatus Wallbacteria bacterium]